MDYIVAIDWRANYVGGGFSYLSLGTDDLIEAKERAVGFAARFATSNGETIGQGIDKIYYLRLLSQTDEQKEQKKAVDTGLSFHFRRFTWEQDDLIGDIWGKITVIY